MKKAMMLWLVLSSLTPNIGVATETSLTNPPSCDQVLNAARVAVDAQKQQIQIRDLRIQQDETRLDQVQQQNDKLRAEDSSLFKNPVLWLLLGAIAGGYVAHH